jgi:hypothetical protein
VGAVPAVGVRTSPAFAQSVSPLSVAVKVSVAAGLKVLSKAYTVVKDPELPSWRNPLWVYPDVWELTVFVRESTPIMWTEPLTAEVRVSGALEPSVPLEQPPFSPFELWPVGSAKPATPE